MIEGLFFSAQKTNNSSAARADDALSTNNFASSFRSFLQEESEKQSIQTENQSFIPPSLVSKTADKNLIEVSAENPTSNETAETAAASALITLNMVPAQDTPDAIVETPSDSSLAINANSTPQTNVDNAQVINSKSTPIDALNTAQTQKPNTAVTISDAKTSTSATLPPSDMTNPEGETPKQPQTQNSTQQAAENLKTAAVKQENMTSSTAAIKTQTEVQSLLQNIKQSTPQQPQQTQSSQQTQTPTQPPADNSGTSQATVQTPITTASNGQTATATVLNTQSNKASNAANNAGKVENANSSSTTSNASATETTSEQSKTSSNTSAPTTATTQAPTTTSNTSNAPPPPQAPNVQDMLSGLPDAELLEGLEPSSEETNLSSTTSTSATGKTQELPPTLRHASSVTQQAWAGMIQRMDGKSHQFQIRLDPAALGQINVSIEITKDKRATVVLAAKSAEALSELSRGSKALESALADIGVDLAEDGLKLELSSDENSSFTFNDDDTEQMADDKGEASSSNSSTNEENTELPRQITPKLTAWSRARVDLRA